MKFRTDFVTNSSSSSFVVQIQVHLKDGRVIDYQETGGDGEITLYKDKKVHEVMNILAGRNISLQTENGLILVEGKVDSRSGNITFETETGEIFLKKNNNHKERR